MSIRNQINHDGDMFLKVLRIAKLATGGAVLSVAAFGTFAPLFGFDPSTQTDVWAALIGGGVTSAILTKMSLLA